MTLAQTKKYYGLITVISKLIAKKLLDLMKNSQQLKIFLT